MKDFSAHPAAVLVVDDDELILRVLRKVLSARFEVHTAETCADAEKVLKTATVEVIVCDHQLPGEDGMSFLTRMRYEYPKVQRILLTGNTTQELMLKGINEARLVRYITKPVSNKELLDAVELAAVEYDIQETMETLALERNKLEESLQHWPEKCRRFGDGVAVIILHIGKLLGGLLSFMIIAAAVTVCLFIFGLLVLYVIKSSLGIDLFANVHFDDVLDRISPFR